MESFLRDFPDPAAQFDGLQSPNGSPSHGRGYREMAIVHLCNEFDRLDLPTLRTIFHECNYRYTPTRAKISALVNGKQEISSMVYGTESG